MRFLFVIIPALILAWVLTTHPRSGPVEGIDVSHWQGDVDWKTVRESGIDFVFLKSTEGLKGVDPSFMKHHDALKSLGMLHGAYHFLKPDVDGAEQARHFMTITKAAECDLLPVVDVETAGPRLPEVLRDYVAEIRRGLDVDPIIYVSPAFWNDNIAPHSSEAWPNILWIAEYGVRTPKATSLIGPWRIWQYTNAGHVPGVEGKVDRDRARSIRDIRMP